MLSWRKEGKESSGAGPSSPPGHTPSPGGHAPAHASPAPPAKPTINPRQRLGEMLVEAGVVTAAQFTEALEKRQRDGGFVGHALVQLGYIDQNTLISFLVKQCKIPHLNLLDYEISESLLDLIPKDICRRHGVLPIDKLGKILTVAMVNPLDVAALEELSAACPGLRLKPILCSWTDFEAVSRRLFADKEEIAEYSPASIGMAALAPTKPAPSSSKLEEPASPPGGASAKAGPQVEEASEFPPIKQQALELSPELWAQAAATAMQGALERVMRPYLERLAGLSAGHTEHAGIDLTPLSEALHVFAREQAAQHARAMETLHEALSDIRDALAAGRGAGEPREKVKERQRGRLKLVQAVDSGDLEALDASEGRSRGDGEVLSVLEANRPLAGYSFDTFLVGKANEFLLKVGKAVAAHPGSEFNPLFIHGGVGCGKTHFLSAIGNSVIASNPDARVGYLTGGEFVRRVDEATAARAIGQFREEFCHWDVLILDDVQLVGRSQRAQEELFQLFNALHGADRQLLLGADTPPERLEGVEKRLISRFAGGFVSGLESPDYTTRLAILEAVAQAEKAVVSHEVLTILATHIPRDIRKLSGALRKVIAFAAQSGQDITSGLTIDVLTELGAISAA